MKNKIKMIRNIRVRKKKYIYKDNKILIMKKKKKKKMIRSIRVRKK